VTGSGTHPSWLPPLKRVRCANGAPSREEAEIAQAELTQVEQPFRDKGPLCKAMATMNGLGLASHA